MHDPGNLILRRALRVAIVLPLAYVAVRYGLDLPAGAPYAGFGTFVLLAFADFGGPTKDRARAYVLAGLAGLVAIAIGTAASNSFWASVIVTFVVCTTLAYSGVLRGYVAAGDDVNPVAVRHRRNRAGGPHGAVASTDWLRRRGRVRPRWGTGPVAGAHPK